MKKTNTGNIDRNTNTNISDYFSSSTIYFPRAAVKAQTGVEIIELNSSNTSESNDSDSLNVAHRHAWSYVEKERPYTKENNYNINSSARERRRMKNKVFPEHVNQHGDLQHECTKFSNTENVEYGYNSFRHKVIKENALPFNPLNRFTILSNEFQDSDQSLTDSEKVLEIIQCGDVILEDNLSVNNDTSEEITNNEKNVNSNAKRTIWIYSFKNKNLLSEDIKQTNSIFKEDSTSSSSPEYSENTSDYRNRAASPIPVSYIPKLDLYVAATLPTVREVAEPYQLTNNNDKTNTTKNFPNSLTPINNWFINKNHNSKDESLSKMDTHLYSNHKTVSSHNIINWMSLSPRNHKRNLHVPNSIKCSDLESDDLSKNIQNQNENIIKDVPNIGDLTYVRSNSNEVINEVITGGDKGLNIDEQLKTDSIDEKGDYNKSLKLKKPFIHLKKILRNKVKTDAVEKLNQDEWIEGTNERRDEINFEIDKDSDKDIVINEEIPKCAGDRLLVKSMSLLKPVEWSQYLPITESIPSLHLSLPSDINEERQSWFKYLIKCICCKKYK